MATPGEDLTSRPYATGAASSSRRIRSYAISVRSHRDLRYDHRTRHGMATRRRVRRPRRRSGGDGLIGILTEQPFFSVRPSRSSALCPARRRSKSGGRTRRARYRPCQYPHRDYIDQRQRSGSRRYAWEAGTIALMPSSSLWRSCSPEAPRFAARLGGTRGGEPLPAFRSQPNHGALRIVGPR